MAKNTKKVTYYEFYTVRRHYQTARGETTMDHMEPIAVFDDKDLAEAYISAREANPNKFAEVKKETYTIESAWTDIEPVESNYNLPFNPTYTLVEGVAVEAKQE